MMPIASVWLVVHRGHDGSERILEVASTNELAETFAARLVDVPADATDGVPWEPDIREYAIDGKKNFRWRKIWHVDIRMIDGVIVNRRSYSSFIDPAFIMNADAPINGNLRARSAKSIEHAEKAAIAARLLNFAAKGLQAPK